MKYCDLGDSSDYETSENNFDKCYNRLMGWEDDN